MPSILASKTTYEFSLDEMKKLFAKELNVSEKVIDISYVISNVGDWQTNVSDWHLESIPHYEVTRIKVIVDNASNCICNSLPD